MRIQIRRIIGGCVAAATSTLSVCVLSLAVAAPASAATYSITGTYGANVRSNPTVSGAILRTLNRGAGIDISCQTIGDRFGSGPYPDNRTWNRLSDGGFVHDNLTSTPGGVRENLAGGGYAYWTPGLPRCDSGTATTYQVAATGGVGVKRRTSPARTSDYNGVAAEGSSITIQCQAWGEPMGSFNNRLWFRVTGSGPGNWWINDTFTNTPRKASDPALPGIAMCNQPTVVNGVDVGRPRNDRHAWGPCTVQDFDGGPHGWVIVSWAPTGPYVVRNGMLWGWVDMNGAPGPLGCPTSSEYATGGGSVRQDFQRGSLVWSPGMDRAVLAPSRWANRIINAATSELGVKMENGPYCFTQRSRNSGRIREYLRYSAPNLRLDKQFCEPWCAGFTTFVLGLANSNNTAKTLRVPDVATWANEGTRGLVKIPEKMVQPGDLIIYDWTGDGGWDHIGIITAKTAASTFNTIEGNSSSRDVSRKSRPVTKWKVMFARYTG